MGHFTLCPLVSQLIVHLYVAITPTTSSILPLLLALTCFVYTKLDDNIQRVILWRFIDEQRFAMRLINARTRKLEEVMDENAEKYAILSHRWEKDEVSFQDMQNLEVATKKKGFRKISVSCKQAVKDDLDYVWVDTCCINKDSSAELSEAINSMYRWYKASAICYAFLSDNKIGVPLTSSVWFTRGWTLQELIAPPIVVFYDHGWSYLGTRKTLSGSLTARTRIDIGILSGVPPSRCSIAQRMSWASDRSTTRPEDKAYCLLGIFDVEMPILYGEGEKAFLRLQEEIIKRSDDHTIFAWPISRHDQIGLLADSPEAFKDCQNVKIMPSREGRSSYSMTNRGLKIKLMAVQFVTDIYFVRLDCVREPVEAYKGPAYDNRGPFYEYRGPAYEYRMGIFLRRLEEDDQYARVQYLGRTIENFEASAWDRDAFKHPQIQVKQIKFHVPQRVTKANNFYFVDHINGFHIANYGLLRYDNPCDVPFNVRAHKWEPDNHMIYMEESLGGGGCFLAINQPNCKIKEIKLGFDFDYNLVCLIATSSGLITKHSLGFSSQEFSAVSSQSPFDTNTPVGSAQELKQQPGLWALKGDRVKGLNVKIRHAKIGNFASLCIIREKAKEKVVWAIYLSEDERSSFGNISKGTNSIQLSSLLKERSDAIDLRSSSLARKAASSTQKPRDTHPVHFDRDDVGSGLTISFSGNRIKFI